MTTYVAIDLRAGFLRTFTAGLPPLLSVRGRMVVLCAVLLFAMLIPGSGGGIARAQVTSPATISASYPLGTLNLGGSDAGTQNTATLNGLGLNQGVTFDVVGTIDDVPSSLEAQWVDGFSFIDNNTLRYQVGNTNIPDGDSAEFAFIFSKTVHGLRFRADNFVFYNGFVMTAYDASNNVVPLTTANITSQGSQVTVQQQGSSLYIGETNNFNNLSEDYAFFDAGITAGIKKIVFSQVGKYTTNYPYNTKFMFDQFAWDVEEDYSDAPSSYQDARHYITSGIQLGSQIDGETASLAGAGATGDDTSGVNDEDGISSFPVLAVGWTSYTIPKANILATGTGTLHAWIDFDQDGAFETGEYASTSVSAGTLSSDLAFSSLPALTDGTTYARFRFTSDAAVTSSTPGGGATASDGEVEDYAITISPVSDFLANAIYATGASTKAIYEISTAGVITNTGGSVVGDPSGFAIVKGGQPSGPAYNSLYFETGTQLVAQRHFKGSATAVGSTVDNWTRAGSTPDGSGVIVIDVGNSGFYRYDTVTGAETYLGPVGPITYSADGSGDIALDASGNGWGIFEGTLYKIDFSGPSPVKTEVGPITKAEDGTNIGFYGLAFGPDDKLYGSGAAADGFRSIDISTGVATLVSGPLPGEHFGDLGSSNFPTFAPALSAPKTGAAATTPVIPGTQLTFTTTVTNSGNAPATNVMLEDPIPVGTVYVAGSTTLNGSPVADASGQMPYSVAGGAKVNSPGASAGSVLTGAGNEAVVAFKVTVGAGATGNASSQGTIHSAELVDFLTDDPSVGGTEDPTVITIPDRDHSDAPTATLGGALHVIDTALKLGTGVTADADDYNSANADGDADDGVASLDPLSEGTTSYQLTSAVTNTTGGAATLHGWVDFDRNGTFDADEYASTAVANGATNATLNWSGIADVSPGGTFIRLRLTTDTTIGAATPGGGADNGEVEDYLLVIAPSADLEVVKTNGATAVTSGSATTYTITVTNNGPSAATGVIVTDTPGAGISCPPANTVTIAGDGVPAGSFTIADLTGSGITLDTLGASQTATLSFSCTVN